MISRAVTGVENRTDAAAEQNPCLLPYQRQLLQQPRQPRWQYSIHLLRRLSRRLCWRISDTEAACVMAIVSHETGIPLDQLVFKSIKAV